VVGLESFAGKRLNGDAVEGKAIGTRGYERKDGQWLVVFHQATPIRQARDGMIVLRRFQP